MQDTNSSTGIQAATSYLMFGAVTAVLGLVLLVIFIKSLRQYQRKWMEMPPDARRRGQITRAAVAGMVTAVVMIADGVVLALQLGSLTVLGWFAMILAVVAYALLYPLSDERRFVNGPLREQ